MNARRKGLTSRGRAERGQFSAVLGHEDFAKQPGKRCRMRERRDVEKPAQAALAGAVRADGRSGFETKLRTSGFGRSRHRTATGPMTVREITDAVLAAKGITDADKRQRLGVEAGIRSSLEDMPGRPLGLLGTAPRNGG
jgi:hypothetical protein